MKTFFMIKPDGVKRNIVGQVIDRVEQEGFKISKMKMMTISSELAEEHRNLAEELGISVTELGSSSFDSSSARERIKKTFNIENPPLFFSISDLWPFF